MKYQGYVPSYYIDSVKQESKERYEETRNRNYQMANYCMEEYGFVNSRFDDYGFELQNEEN